MARRGRPRSTGARKPCGELKRDKAAQQRKKLLGERELVSTQPHRRSVPEKSRLSQSAATSIGRMFLRGEITEAEMQAADYVVKVRNQLNRLRGAPSTQLRSTLTSMVYTGVETAEEAEPYTPEFMREPDEERIARLDQINAIVEKVLAPKQVDAIRARALNEPTRRDVFDRILFDDVDPSPPEVVVVKILLRTLASRFGMTDEKPREIRGFSPTKGVARPGLREFDVHYAASSAKG